MVERSADPVLDGITQTILERFAPERIVLFGSRARGDHRPDSDYDIMVMIDAASEEAPRRTHVREALGRERQIDVLVYTPTEFERCRDDVGDMAYVVDREGQVLYDRQPSRWARRIREKPPGPPKSLAKWLDHAADNLRSMEALVVHSADSRDSICHMAHEGVEKLLKAVLVSQGTRPPRTHNLAELLAMGPRELRDDRNVNDACLVLDQLRPYTRYPPNELPSARDAARAVAAARTVQAAVRATLTRAT